MPAILLTQIKLVQPLLDRKHSTGREGSWELDQTPLPMHLSKRGICASHPKLLFSQRHLPVAAIVVDLLLLIASCYS